MIKKYNVLVSAANPHGRYGKENYFELVVKGKNRKEAEEIASNCVDCMSFREFFKNCVNSYYKNEDVQNQFMMDAKRIKKENGYFYITRLYRHTLDERVTTNHRFSYKATLIKE